MIILGIDPGTVNTGFGIVNFKDNSFTRVHAGVVKLSSKDPIPLRLDKIYDTLDKVIKTYRPEKFAVESAFYGKNIQSTLKIGYAKGAAILAAVHNGLPVLEYSPREVKKSVTGKGSATKEQVQYMVLKLLGMKPGKMIFDESDALAIAICHGLKQNSLSPKSGSWSQFIKSNPDRVV